MYEDRQKLDKYIYDSPKRVAQWSKADREAFAERTNSPVVDGMFIYTQEDMTRAWNDGWKQCRKEFTL